MPLNYNKNYRPDSVPSDSAYVRKRKPKFNPDQAYIDLAIADFLAKGGKITVIENISELPINYGHSRVSGFSNDDP